MDAETTKENCELHYYFNNTDVNPAVLDGGHETVLANWPNKKHVICNDNKNIPIKIPSPPYVLVNRTVLCNCGIEVEDNFLLELIATCYGKQSDLIMYFTVNITFMHYLDNLTNALDVCILQDWTTHEQVLPFSLQTFDFNSKLLEAPKSKKILSTNTSKRSKYWINMRIKVIK